MMRELKTDEEEVIKTKNLKRVNAGKKGAEARKMKAELKRKEMDAMKKENIELKSITKDDNEVSTDKQNINIYKNYVPLCIVVIGVAGLGLYMYNKKDVVKQREVVQLEENKNVVQKKEIDPFELR